MSINKSISINDIFWNIKVYIKYVVKKHQKQLSPIQKDIIMFNQARRDIYRLNYYLIISLLKLMKLYKEYYIVQLIYKEIKKLEEYQILKKINKRDSGYYIEYKLINELSSTKKAS